jgi:hypothetical protein
MLKTSLILVFLFLSAICFAQKKGSKKSKTKTQPKAVEMPAGYVEKRKIKYLCDDGIYVTVFFDNGKAGLVKDFIVCEENLNKLYAIPTPYSYELIKVMNEPMIAISKECDDAPSGIKLSKDWWYIKEFEEVKEIKKCP